VRIDKFIQLIRVIKSRKYSKLACEKGYVYVNDKKVKPSYRVKKGDRILIELVDRRIELEVLEIPDKNFSKSDIERYVKFISYTKKKLV